MRDGGGGVDSQNTNHQLAAAAAASIHSEVKLAAREQAEQMSQPREEMPIVLM